VLPYVPEPEPLTRLADGTVKQWNPLTGTEVWTVPGRGHRPLNGASPRDRGRVDHSADGRHCALCHLRYLETPPEKSRVIRSPTGVWQVLSALPAERLFETVAEFRRIPNLFEILSYDYWRANYRYELPEHRAAHLRHYLGSPAGRAHTMAVSRARLSASGVSEREWERLDEEERLAPAQAFFGGGHELVVARRHFTDGATYDDELAGSGTLDPEEHERYLACTVDALQAIYEDNRFARYVAVFQNWLAPAGASFDHLHKQLVAIDERGRQAELELSRLRANPNLYNEAAVNYAGYHRLLVARNEHAVAFAGFGHRYPTLEVYSASARTRPWELPPEELRAMSDVVHACHAASGSAVASNEEWHHRPADVEVPMPWRILLKWRISTPAGFEGGTKIYVNTIDPWALRDRVVERLRELRDQGRVAPMAIGDECSFTPNLLRYQDALG
jgi:galactose-1-phosphate uridylyltransferase